MQDGNRIGKKIEGKKVDFGVEKVYKGAVLAIEPIALNKRP